MKLAIITDIHEDNENLAATLKAIERFKVDEIVCLGDISGYSIPYYNHIGTRNAHECITLIKANCKYVVLGNHDIQAAKIIPKTSPFFTYPDNWYQLSKEERHALGKDTIWLHEENDLNPQYTEEDISYLQSLPEYISLNVGAYTILLSHYVYPNISGIKKEFFSYTDEMVQHFNFMLENNCQISFTGHTHARGFLAAHPRSNRQHFRRSYTLKKFPICIGLPAIANHRIRGRFTIFNSDDMKLHIHKV